MEKNIITCKSLCKGYFDNVALDNVDLNIEVGGITGIFGGSGSGKTALMKVISGVSPYDSGILSVLGKQPGKETKDQTSYLPEEICFNKLVRGTDYISFYADFYSDFNEQLACKLIKKLGLPANTRLRDMNQTDCRALQVILALSRTAKLYLLDEPFHAFDGYVRETLVDALLNNQRPDSTILIVSNHISETEHMLDNVIFMQKGKIILHGRADVLRTESGLSIEELYKRELNK